MPDQLITSSSPHGCVIAMNMWVHADKVPEVLDIMRLVLEKLKADPNCLYIDTCQNPQDPAHLRFVHGWKTDSKYFYETFQTQDWFKDYLNQVAPLRLDRDRVIEHFDRIPM